MKKDLFLSMYSLISTDIERFFQRYTSHLHYHNKIMMYISGIFIDLAVGKIRKMNSYNSIFFKIKDNKVLMRSKKCKVLYNNIMNFTEGESAFKDLMNMIFSIAFPSFELSNVNVVINFHNQKVLEIKTDKPYKIFVFRNSKSVDKNFVRSINLIKSVESNGLHNEIIKHVLNNPSESSESSNTNENENNIAKVIEAKRIEALREFAKKIEEIVRGSWLYSFRVINNIIDEKIAKDRVDIREEDIKKTFFIIRSFLNELPSHINIILRVFTQMIIEKHMKIHNIDGLDSIIMKTMSSNFYIQKGLQNIYIFFKDLIGSDTDILKMKNMIKKYNISVEVYSDGALVLKQNVSDYFKAYERFIMRFKGKLKERMKKLRISNVKIKKNDLGDHIAGLLNNSIRLQKNEAKIPISDRENHINFYIKYNMVSEKIAMFLLNEISKQKHK